MRTIYVVTVVATWALFAGCCDKGTRRIHPYWLHAMEPYELVQTELIRRTDGYVHATNLYPVPQSRERCFKEDGIEGCIRDQRYGFWLDLTNRSGETIKLLWPDAQYVDEVGRAHDVHAKPAGGGFPDPTQMLPGPVIMLQPDEKDQKLVVFPIYKSYWTVGHCRSDYVPYREPLIPTNLSDVQRFPDEASVKAYVDDLAKRQVPVKLILPIEIEGKRHDYTFTFVLRDRWADGPDE